MAMNWIFDIQIRLTLPGAGWAKFSHRTLKVKIDTNAINIPPPNFAYLSYFNLTQCMEKILRV